MVKNPPVNAGLIPGSEDALEKDNPGIESESPALQVDSLPTEPSEKPLIKGRYVLISQRMTTYQLQVVYS